MTTAQKKQILHDYILLKLSEGDYHAVADAANDLRVLEAQGLQKSSDGAVVSSFADKSELVGQ